MQQLGCKRCGIIRGIRNVNRNKRFHPEHFVQRMSLAGTFALMNFSRRRIISTQLAGYKGQLPEVGRKVAF